MNVHSNQSGIWSNTEFYVRNSTPEAKNFVEVEFWWLISFYYIIESYSFL